MDLAKTTSNLDNNVDLEIYELEDNVNYCATFHYHMYGTDDMRLQFRSSRDVLWEKRGRKFFICFCTHKVISKILGTEQQGRKQWYKLRMAVYLHVSTLENIKLFFFLHSPRSWDETRREILAGNLSDVSRY